MQTILRWLQHNKEWVFSGAGVAVLTVLVSWLASQKSHVRARFRVNATFGFLTFGPDLSDQMLLFTVANTSERRMQVAGIRVPLSGNRNLFFPGLGGERPIPCLVEAGTNVKFWIDVNELQTALRRHGYAGTHKIRAVVTDGTGVEHKSNAVKLAT